MTKKNVLLFALGFFLSLFVATSSILVYFLQTGKNVAPVNVLLLGASGPGNSTPDLTDTIIFASFNTNGSVLISVPRDLWYEPWQAKVNTLYFYGEEKEGNGLGKTKEILGEILGQKIDYAFLIDFAVFKDLVDLAGGVDVMVERTFDDNKYPISGRENDLCNGDPDFACRYEHVRFEQGLNHFDGSQALKFVRSRNAENEEGTDSARSNRQQQVISALKEKFTSPSFFLSMQKIRTLQEIYKMRIKTDWEGKDFSPLLRIFMVPSARSFQSFVIDGWQEEKGLIYHPQKHSSGQWVLLPRDPSWNEIRQFVNCLFSQPGKSSCSRSQIPAGSPAL